LTLFLAVILFGGDLITLINTYLNGEISSRFVYKVLVVFLIAGSVGKYYFFSLYPTHRFAKMARQVNAWFGIVIVIVAIVVGFVAVGSPAKQRALRFDNQRVGDLSNIQGQVVYYWQQKQKLPVVLTDLNDTLSGFIVPSDPETKAVYEYAIKVATSTKTIPGAMSFELCATFGESSQDTKGRGAFGGGMMYPVAYEMSYPSPVGGIENVWNHDKGRTCFDRTIDPDKYPINKPIPLKQ
jgi:hypothetical protein